MTRGPEAEATMDENTSRTHLSDETRYHLCCGHLAQRYFIPDKRPDPGSLRQLLELLGVTLERVEKLTEEGVKREY
jgi:hypothetical protein